MTSPFLDPQQAASNSSQLLNGRAAQSKSDLRKRLKKLRHEMSESSRQAIDVAIADQVLQLPEFKRAPMLLSYLSVGEEVDTRALIQKAWDLNKTVAIPRCVAGSRTLDWYVIESFAGLEKSSFGIEEPARDSTRYIDPRCAEAIALVPGLAFDAAGYRIGYGGGYYDVFLESFPGFSIGLCRDNSLLSHLELQEPHDRPVSCVVSESRVLCRSLGS